MKINDKIWRFYLQEKSLAGAVKLLIPAGALYDFCKQQPRLEALTISSVSTSPHTALCGFGIAAAAWTFLLPMSSRTWPCLVFSQIITDLLAVLFCNRRWDLGEGKHTNKLRNLLAVSVIHPWALGDGWALVSVMARCCGSESRCEEFPPVVTAALAWLPSRLPGWSSGFSLEVGCWDCFSEAVKQMANQLHH